MPVRFCCFLLDFLLDLVFRLSSSSCSSIIVIFGSMAICANILARRREGGFPWCFLRSRANPGWGIRHLNSPVFQLILGFCSFNHGKPSMIFCFPRQDTNNWDFIVLLLMVRSRLTKWVIFPSLFTVPSTFLAVIGSLSTYYSHCSPKKGKKDFALCKSKNRLRPPNQEYPISNSGSRTVLEIKIIPFQ